MTLLALCLSASAQARTIPFPGAYPTIQDTINAAASGDTILIADGTYSGSGNRNLDPAGKSLTITSQHGPASTIIFCGISGRGFYLHSGETNTVISGLTIDSGVINTTPGVTAPPGSTDGGGMDIINTGTITISNCNFTGNLGDNGAAIYNSNSGTVTISSCNFTNNQAYGGDSSDYNNGNGGAIFNDNTAGTTSIVNCTIVGNHATRGAGICNMIESGTVSITNCSIVRNFAVLGGGGINNFFGGNGSTLNLTNDISQKNVVQTAPFSPEPINGQGDDFYTENGALSGYYSSGTQIYVIRNCDFGSVGEGYLISDPSYFYVNGSFSADPLFVGDPQNYLSSQPIDLHLKVGSPCLGAGTANGAPTTTLDGQARPNPPSIGAYELPIATQTHLLWDNTSGAASIWNYDILHGTFTQNTYGPYAGWTAKAIADGGTDELTRVLWDNADGRMSLWSLNNASTAFTQFTFGPYPGWTANAISVGSDNTTHILWDNTNGLASIWNYSTANGTFTQNTYGPYAGWTAKAIADGPNGLVRVLWDNSDGRMSLWSLNNRTGAFTQYTFGPYPGWTATGVSVAPDNTTHILWHNTDGRVSIWNYNTTSGTFTQNTYGAYSGWTAKSLADGSDGTLRVLWGNTSGATSLWSLNNSVAAFSQFSFGPYGNWTAASISGN